MHRHIGPTAAVRIRTVGLFSLFFLLLSSPPATAQSGPSVRTAHTSAHVEIPAVVRLYGQSQRSVTLATGNFAAPGDIIAAGSDDGERWARANRTLRLRSAGNVPHQVTIRRTESGPVSVEWSRDGGETWRILTGMAVPVEAAMAPGRHDREVDLRFRVDAASLPPADSRTVPFELNVAVHSDGEGTLR